jgi:anti-sigma B factor antagonist
MFDRDGHNVPDRVKTSVVSRRLGHGVVVAVNGELDLVSAPIVGSELEKAAQSLDLVAIDLTETTFIDSAGLHMLITADRSLRERGGHLVIVGSPPQASRVMELTGMDERFDMVSDLSELERRISSSGELIHRAPSSTP